MRLRSLRSLPYGARNPHPLVLTVRHGAHVERFRFDDLKSALAELEEQVRVVRREGPLEEVSMLRRFEPESRVAARLEISTGGWLRKRDAGIDVMGDGTLVAYSGGIRRRELIRDRDLGPTLEAACRALHSRG